MRSVALSVGAVLWSVCFGAAVLTVVPLSAMGLVAVFQGSSTIVDRLQGFGPYAFQSLQALDDLVHGLALTMHVANSD
jgi:hypothetical protein